MGERNTCYLPNVDWNKKVTLKVCILQGKNPQNQKKYLKLKNYSGNYLFINLLGKKTLKLLKKNLRKRARNKNSVLENKNNWMKSFWRRTTMHDDNKEQK